MVITLDQVGKKFNSRWLFNGISLHLHTGSTLAITGDNGSGKSTLLQIIFGYVSPSKGSVTYTHHEQQLAQTEWATYGSFSSPLLELPELLTMREVIAFHFKFKEKLAGFEEAIAQLKMEQAYDKQIKFFSSGMKQRLKLALSIYSNSEVLLLDEPCANLDEHGIKWYCDTIQKMITNRIFIVASNQKIEYDFCQSTLHLNAQTD